MFSDAADVVLMEGPAPVEPPDNADNDGPASPLPGLAAATLAGDSAVTAGVLLKGGATTRLVDKTSAAGFLEALPEPDISEHGAAAAAGMGEQSAVPLIIPTPGVTGPSATPAAVAGVWPGDACRIDACLRVAVVCASTAWTAACLCSSKGATRRDAASIISPCSCCNKAN